MFPEPEYTAFFTDFYSADAFPECLLRPPPGWSPTATLSLATPGLQGVGDRSESCSTAGGIRALPESRRTRVAEIHAALYCAAGASYDEVFEALPALLTGAPGEESASLVEGVPLIGGHGDNDAEGGAGQLERHSPLLFDVVRGIVEQWPQPPDPIRGRSLNDVLQTVQVKPQRSSSNRAILRSLIRKVAGQGGGGTVRRMEMDSAVTSSPIPGLDRRSMVLRLLGQSPLLHNSHTPWKRSLPSGERVHVYLDVSGSMESLIKALYGAVLDCEGWVFPVVHLFSTKVADVSLTELRRGICQTTGGTDIASVARHMATHRVRRALLITDGWVGIPRGQNLNTLKRVRLAVAFTGVNVNTKDLGAVANHTAVLEPPGASTNPRSSQKPNVK
jgi:hypothetical protein